MEGLKGVRDAFPEVTSITNYIGFNKKKAKCDISNKYPDIVSIEPM